MELVRNWYAVSSAGLFGALFTGVIKDVGPIHHRESRCFSLVNGSSRPIAEITRRSKPSTTRSRRVLNHRSRRYGWPS